ncbi:MAG: hypothetical protein ABIH63_04270 [archaeon]
MKVRNIFYLTIYGVLCMFLGAFIIGVLDFYFKRNMVQVRLNTKHYEADILFKNPLILVINRIDEVERRVQGGMEDMLIDLMAPSPFQKVFSKINKEKLDEKKKLVEAFKDFLQEKKVEGETEL